MPYAPEGASLADRIRRFAFEKYVMPLRGTPDAEIRIRAGDVHKAMGLSGRMPAVCGALDSNIFRREFGLALVRRIGPNQGANVEFGFRNVSLRPNPTELSIQPVTPASGETTAPLSHPTTAKRRFTLRGETFEKERSDFLRVMEGKEPGRIQKYSTVIDGKRYPIRQVVASVTNLSAIAITSQDAYRILSKFNFIVESNG